MLVAKGTRVTLELANGRRVRPRGAMLHDETGREWDSQSVLFHPFKRGGASNAEISDAETDRSAIAYFGYVPRAGTVELPDREDIADWDSLGEVRGITYDRPGGKPSENDIFFSIFAFRPDENYKGEYEHTFKDGWWIFRTGKPRLFRLGRWYCMQMPPWSEINWRGFVSP